MANLLKFHRGAAAPSTLVAGIIWFDTENKVVKVYNGSAWEVYGSTPADLAAVVERVTELETVTIPGLENTLKGLITAEENRAKGEEARIEGLVTAEVEAREQADLDLKAELLGDAAEDYNTLGKLEDKIQAVEAAAVSVKEGTINHVKVTKSGTEYTVEGVDVASAEALAKEITDARAAEKGLADRLDIIEGEATVAGSIKKALADANAYTDAAKAAIEGTLADTDAKTLAALNDRIDEVVADAKTYSVVKVTEGLGANIKEAYKLVDEDQVQCGALIEIEKDDSLVNVETTTDEKGNQVVKFTYNLADGTSKEVTIDLSAYVTESEYGDGLQVVDHVISVKRDATSEAFLTVGADGVKLAGVQDAIDTAIEALDATVGSSTVEEGKHVAVEVVETDGKLTGLTVVESDIASAAALATLDAEVQEHEVVVAAALNDLNERLAGVAGDLAGKNVDAEGDAYVSATAADNKVTVAATESTKASLALADSAVQTVASAGNTLQVTRTANAVNVELCWMEGSF